MSNSHTSLKEAAEAQRRALLYLAAARNQMDELMNGSAGRGKSALAAAGVANLYHTAAITEMHLVELIRRDWQ